METKTRMLNRYRQGIGPDGRENLIVSRFPDEMRNGRREVGAVLPKIAKARAVIDVAQ